MGLRTKGTRAREGYNLHFDTIKFVPKADYACSPAFRYLASGRIDDCDTTLKAPLGVRQ